MPFGGLQCKMTESPCSTSRGWIFSFGNFGTPVQKQRNSSFIAALWSFALCFPLNIVLNKIFTLASSSAFSAFSYCYYLQSDNRVTMHFTESKKPPLALFIHKEHSLQFRKAGKGMVRFNASLWCPWGFILMHLFANAFYSSSLCTVRKGQLKATQNRGLRLRWVQGSVHWRIPGCPREIRNPSGSAVRSGKSWLRSSSQEATASQCRRGQTSGSYSALCLELGVVPVLLHLQNQMKQKSGLKTLLPPHPLRCKTCAVQTCRRSQQASPSGRRGRIGTEEHTGVHKGCHYLGLNIG